MSELILVVSSGDYDSVVCRTNHLLMPFAYAFYYLRFKLRSRSIYLGSGCWSQLRDCQLSVHKPIGKSSSMNTLLYPPKSR